MEGKKDMFVSRQQAVVINVTQAMRVLVVGLEAHDVDDINHSDFEGVQLAVCKIFA